MAENKRGKSVAIIGAGASGVISAVVFKAEKYFDKIKIFERRESAGGTWIYDPSPSSIPLEPGSLPTELDPPLKAPNELPKTTSANEQERFLQTPIYSSLTTNVPAIAMAYSDIPFPYGPFVPHHIPKQYIEHYLSHHQLDSLVSFNTTVENLSLNKPSETWTLTLRHHNPVINLDTWYSETYDYVILSNGHYTIPFIPSVPGLKSYISNFPHRVSHSKTYRTPLLYKDKKVLIIGSSASAHDLAHELIHHVQLPLYQSRRSPARWDGPVPAKGIIWKPIISSYETDGTIIFSDDTKLGADEIDIIIYCTGYLPSYPFWDSKTNGGEIYNYTHTRLEGSYIHTFFPLYPTLGIVGMPKVLTFRSFEYQAIALSRLFSGRSIKGLPEKEVMKKWEIERQERRKREGKKFHDVEWETGETREWLDELFGIAGLGLLTGEGRTPPVLGEDVRWAVENVRKYVKLEGEVQEVKEKESEGQEGGGNEKGNGKGKNKWVVIKREEAKDLLSFI